MSDCFAFNDLGLSVRGIAWGRAYSQEKLPVFLPLHAADLPAFPLRGYRPYPTICRVTLLDREVAA